MFRTTSPAPHAWVVLLLAGALGAVAPAVASAHAALLESTPRDGEVVAASPAVAVLRFNSRIEKRLTRAVLTGEDGKPVALAPAPEGSDDPPDRVSLQLPPLASGAYRLTYRVLAADGHATPGLIRFTVRAGGTGR
ncbi:copper resistance CopC family protein [Anaeromyxobacter oryzae]|uniref:CopC domain-containing protein n=1 Tax=Anaeromyxobacter oryzae TaxID=2918170 RepID=A0ABN6MTP4_9BACT|nr:copper resistance CopC family protein [Anaeromyxobacter oryzae]BDG03134.1 hypothetical protein AMOR_21300 [Anaeromyxobacter oryzae]